jgi:hypothetical protein
MRLWPFSWTSMIRKVASSELPPSRRCVKAKAYAGPGTLLCLIRMGRLRSAHRTWGDGSWDVLLASPPSWTSAYHSREVLKGNFWIGAHVIFNLPCRLVFDHCICFCSASVFALLLCQQHTWSYTNAREHCFCHLY